MDFVDIWIPEHNDTELHKLCLHQHVTLVVCIPLASAAVRRKALPLAEVEVQGDILVGLA